jgi:carbamoyltransferase
MIYWGINALNHGSSLAVFKDDKLLTNLPNRSDELPESTVDVAKSLGYPNHIFWYEQPWLKKLRQLRSGQWHRAVDGEVLPVNYLKKFKINIPITYTPHHGSHAAAGYYTSPFDRATVIVLDAIGEWESATIWRAEGTELTKIWSKSYPNSLGLFYSAFTDLLGLTPIVEEGTLQRWSANGDSNRYYDQVKKYFKGTVQLRYNLHKGVRNWPFEIANEQDRNDIAAAVQAVFEDQVHAVHALAKSIGDSSNLVYMGGCAFNSQANVLVSSMWDKIWSLPNPGDASSSIGAVLYHTKKHIEWPNGVVNHIRIRV